MTQTAPCTPIKDAFLFGLLLTGAGVSVADDTVSESTPLQVSGNVVVTHQAADESYIENEMAGSADLILEYQVGSGTWLAHVEASSTPKANRVSEILPEANADVGSALDENSEGRIQLSELYYTYHFANEQSLAAGLIDVSGFFEQSRVASDETTQFMGAFFVGNPTIAFPDYTLGFVYENALENNVVLRAALANSDGLADNPERSYSQLLTVDSGEGVFGVASASWEAKRWLLRAGAWVNTAKDEPLDMTEKEQMNYGAYLLAGYTKEQHSANIRVGIANSDVSQAATFLGAAYRYQLGRYTVGAAAGRAFLSTKEPSSELGDTNQYELFVRYTLSKGLYLTGDVQRIDNSNFGELPENRERQATVYGVRFTWLYE